MTTFKTKWEYGESVYLKTDSEQDEYVITGFVLRPNGFLIKVSSCGTEVEVYEFEVSREKDKLKGMGLDKEDVEDD